MVVSGVGGTEQGAGRMLKSIMRSRGLVFAIGAAAALPMLAGTAFSQNAPSSATNPDAVLEQRSQQLEEQLVQEHQQMQAMEQQLRDLQNAIRARTGNGKTPPIQAAVVPPGHQTSWSVPTQTTTTTTNQPSNAGTPQLQASSGSRKTPAVPVSVEAAYLQQNALFRPGLTFYPQFTYSYSNNRNLVLNGFLALDSIFLGNIDVTRTETDIFSWNPQIFYAFNRSFEINVNVPYMFEWTSFKSVGVQNSTGNESNATVNKWGLGDVGGGFYWQLLKQHGWFPSLIWNSQFSAPTGTSPFGIKLVTDPSNSSLKFPNNLPTGKGVWGVSSGFSIIRELDPIVLFGSGNFFYEFSQHVNDVSTTYGQTQPGEVAPGNAISYTLGGTLALNERFSVMAEMQDLITNSTQVKPDGGSWQAVNDSSTNAAQFIFGATYAASRNLFPYIQAGIGATQAAPNFQISLFVPYYFNF